MSRVWSNLATAGCANYTILPVAVSSGGGTVRFTINYGNSSLGATRDSGFYSSKPGHEITVDTVALDDLIEDRDLAPPNFVKIDIEGAEVLALEGMRRTLTMIQPTLLLELHGVGPGVESLRIVQAVGYRTEEATTGHVFASPSAAVTLQGDGIWHVLCRPPRAC
jgi:FkbM family methyltransferase